MKLSKNKFFNILIFSFTISIILFYSSKINISKKIDKKIRNLLTDIQIEEICKAGKEKISELYLLNTYEYETNYQSNKYVQYLIDFLHTEDNQNLIDYAPRVLILLIVLAFDIILIFFFFGYCCCLCCCPCKCCSCCCCGTGGKNGCCLRVSFILSFLFFATCMISSLYGIDKGNKFTKSINSTSCSIFKIYAHFIFGDDCNEIPKWPGFKEIKNLIQTTFNDIDVIKKYTKPVIANYTAASNANIFENNFIENEYKKFDKNEFTIDIIDDGINNSSKSVYFDLYYDMKTNLNYTLQDYKYLSFALDIFKEVKDIALEIENNKDIEVNLNDSILQLDDINETFNDLSTKVLDELYDYQKEFNKYSERGVLGFFLILSIFPALSIISLILFLCLCDCSRFLFYISWIINMLIIIIFSIIGVVFGILGIIGKDGVGVMEYIISNDNLEKMDESIIIKGEGAKYLNICFNDDGDLQRVLDLNTVDSNGTGSLNELYQKKDIVDNISSYLNVFPGWMTELILIEKNFENYYKTNKGFNFYDSKTNKKGSLSEVINQLRYYTDKGKNKNAKFYHWWTIPEINCDNNYIYTKNPISLTEKYCLNLSDVINCLEDYKTIEIDETHNLCDVFLNYQKSILNFKNKYIDEIGNLITHFDEYLENNLNFIKLRTAEGIGAGMNMIDPIYKIYYKFLGGNSNNIFSVLNCRFLKKDSHILFDVLNKDLGENSRKLSYCIFISCFSSAFGIFFGLIGVLSSFYEKKDKQTKPDDNTKTKEEIKNEDNSKDKKDNTNYEDNKNESSANLKNKNPELPSKKEEEINPNDIEIDMNNEEGDNKE